MSRSRRKVPMIGHTTADSEKADKRAAHQRERAKLREAIAGADDDETVAPKAEHRRSGRATFAKDGKSYLSGANDRLMRK